MTTFGRLAQDWPDDMVAAISITKDNLIAALKAGEFDQIAAFEMVGETFQQSMNEYIRQLRQKTGAPVSVVVLVEASSPDG